MSYERPKIILSICIDMSWIITKPEFMYKQFFKKDDNIDDYCLECYSYIAEYIDIHNGIYTLCALCYNKLDDISKILFTDEIEILDYSFGVIYHTRSIPKCFMCNNELNSDGHGTEWGYKRWYHGHSLINSKLNICMECYEKLK